MSRVDLHVHTNISDGILSPVQVVAEAARKKIAAVAITDHDTMQGMPSARKAGKKLGLEIVPGVELSVNYGQREIHILGFFCDPDNSYFKKSLEAFKFNRYYRMIKMIKKLKKLGINIELADVFKIVKGEMPGRPHLAVALYQKGYCKTPAEAFHKFIGPDGPAYVKRMKFNPFDAINIIRNARGIPVLAHPGLYGEDRIVPVLVNAGLIGIEVFHPDHTAFDKFRYYRLAKKYNLLITGGSDFHGFNIGSASSVGAITLSYSYLEKLKETNRIIKEGKKFFTPVKGF